MSPRPLRLGVICAGQGEQGDIDFAAIAPRQDDPPEVAALWRETSECVGADWAEFWQALSAGGRQSNQIAQLAVVLYQSVRWLRLRSRLPAPSWVLGYSIGELTAHGLAGSLDFAALPALAAARGAAMDRAYPPAGGACLVLLGERLPPLTRARRDAALAALGLELAIERSAQEQIWGADAQSVAAFLEASHQVGWGARALRVHVPSHTRWMSSAQAAWRAALGAAKPRAPVVGMLAGIDAAPVRSADGVIETLVRQLAEPIRWADCLEAIAEHGVTHVLDLGPGGDQGRLAAAALPNLNIVDPDNLQDLSGLIGAVDD